VFLFLATRSCSAAVKQTFSTFFTDVDNANTNEPRPKSGNPGYLVGNPLLSGTVQTNGDLSAVAQDVDGLVVLPRSITGECSSTGSGTQVTFGEDLFVSCTLPLDLTTLESM
jgi:hypothetical protein